MKKKNIWFAGTLTLVLAGAAVAAVGLSAKTPEVTKAGVGETITCKVNKTTSLTELPTAMWVYIWAEAGDAGTGSTAVAAVAEEMTLGESTTDSVTFTFTGAISTYYRLIFKDTAGTTSWNNQSDNLFLEYQRSVDSSYACHYTISSLNSNKYGGGWSSNLHTYSSGEARLWVDRQSNYTDGYLWTEHHWKTGADIETPVAGYTNVAASGDRYLAYFNVPSSIIGSNYQFKAYTFAGKFADSVTASGIYASGDNAKLMYVSGTAGALTLSSGVAASTAQTLSAASMKDVLDGYFTCSSDMDNGYGNFKQVVTTWIHNFADPQVWWILGEMSSTTTNDFTKTADYATGANRTASVDLYSKYNEMSALYDAANPSGEFKIIDDSNDSMVLSMVLLSAGLLAGIVVYLCVRKHKVTIA